jgi:SAM-dependent methyltransferase
MDANNTKWQPTGDMALVFHHLPDDASWQSHSLGAAFRVLEKYLPPRRLRILDVGCGAGNSFYEFRKFDRELLWTGLDIVDSPEACARTRDDLNCLTFDGIHIPINDQEIDLAYSRQVFEHVRHPRQLLEEIYRVLKSGGHFVGSTSHLEPFHSRSYWNYTPYGFCVLLMDSGFDSVVIRPGIDGLTLIGRRILSHVRLSKLFDSFFETESPLNFLLELISRAARMPAKRRNALKLLFSGHFTFVATKYDERGVCSGDSSSAPNREERRAG